MEDNGYFSLEKDVLDSEINKTQEKVLKAINSNGPDYEQLMHTALGEFRIHLGNAKKIEKHYNKDLTIKMNKRVLEEIVKYKKRHTPIKPAETEEQKQHIGGVANHAFKFVEDTDADNSDHKEPHTYLTKFAEKTRKLALAACIVLGISASSPATFDSMGISNSSKASNDPQTQAAFTEKLEKATKPGDYKIIIYVHKLQASLMKKTENGYKEVRRETIGVGSPLTQTPITNCVIYKKVGDVNETHLSWEDDEYKCDFSKTRMLYLSVFSEYVLSKKKLSQIKPDYNPFKNLRKQYAIHNLPIRYKRDKKTRAWKEVPWGDRYYGYTSNGCTRINDNITNWYGAIYTNTPVNIKYEAAEVESDENNGLTLTLYRDVYNRFGNYKEEVMKVIKKSVVNHTGVNERLLDYAIYKANKKGRQSIDMERLFKKSPENELFVANADEPRAEIIRNRQGLGVNHGI